MIYGMFQVEPYVVQKTTCQTAIVTGMVLITRRLVVCHAMNDNLYVYQTSSIEMVETLKVAGLTSPQHIVKLPHEGTLLISDKENMLFWVSLSIKQNEKSNVQIKKRAKMKYKLLGMCVTGNNKVIICAQEKNQLYKYSATGAFEGRIELLENVKPYHIIYHATNNRNFITDYHNKQFVLAKQDGTITHTMESSEQLGRPFCITQDRRGHVLVTDVIKHSVLAFDSAGHFKGQLLGEENGLFKPKRLLLDQDNDILYVACEKPVRVVIYEYTPLLVALHIVQKTADQKQVVAGMVIIKGRLVVAHGANDNLYVYQISNNTVMETLKVEGVTCPQHIVKLPHRDTLLISDQANILFWVSLSIKRNGPSTAQIRKTVNLNYTPFGMCVTEDSKIIICDQQRGRLCKYNTVGEYEGLIQLPENVQPHHIISHKINNRYSFTDYHNRQLVLAENDGAILLRIESSEQRGRPCCITQDKRGHVLVTDIENHKVLVFDHDGLFKCKLLDQKNGLHRPRCLLLDQDKDKLYVSCEKPVRVVVYEYTLLLDECLMKH